MMVSIIEIKSVMIKVQAWDHLKKTMIKTLDKLRGSAEQREASSWILITKIQIATTITVENRILKTQTISRRNSWTIITLALIPEATNILTLRKKTALLLNFRIKLSQSLFSLITSSQGMRKMS